MFFSIMYASWFMCRQISSAPSAAKRLWDESVLIALEIAALVCFCGSSLESSLSSLSSTSITVLPRSLNSSKISSSVNSALSDVMTPSSASMTSLALNLVGASSRSFCVNAWQSSSRILKESSRQRGHFVALCIQYLTS